MGSTNLEASATCSTNLAKDVLMEFACEWEGCQAILNCWRALQQHLFHHCTKARQQDSGFLCKMSRCAGRVHPNLAILKSHIELSHMSRVNIPCPIKGCEDSFQRVHHVVLHMSLKHSKESELLETVGNLSPNFCNPSAQPIQPLTRSISLPPLPSGLSLPHVANPLFVAIPSREQKAVDNSKQSLGRKWSRLDVPDEDGEEPIEIEFEDLHHSPSGNGAIKSETVDIIARRKPPELDLQLARPQRLMISPPLPKKPPKTILYDTFARRVDELVANGLL